MDKENKKSICTSMQMPGSNMMFDAINFETYPVYMPGCR